MLRKYWQANANDKYEWCEIFGIMDIAFSFHGKPKLGSCGGEGLRGDNLLWVIKNMIIQLAMEIRTC